MSTENEANMQGAPAKQGILDGVMRCYAPSGALTAILPHRGGFMDGEAVFGNGEKALRRAQYRMGKLDGLCEDFYETGGRLRVTMYRNGLMDGPCLSSLHPGHASPLDYRQHGHGE